MDLTLRDLQRQALAGDHEAFLQMCRIQDRAGIVVPVTQISDNHSGGGTKFGLETIWIEAPKDIAIDIFTARFGRTPYGTSCDCCGPDFSIEEYEDFQQATGYERGCDFDRALDGYIETPRRPEYSWPEDPYTPLEPFIEQHRGDAPPYLIITRYDFTPQEARIFMGSRRNPLPLGQRPRNKPNYCKICGASTKEGKLYCTEHVEQTPYAAQLQSLVEQSDQEVAQVKRQGPTAIQPDSIILGDLIATLKEHGAASIAKLAVLMGLDADIVQVYSEYLINRGFALWETLGAKGTKHVALVSDKARLRTEVDADIDRTLSSGDIAKEFGVSLASISAWAKKGAPHNKIKGRLFFNLNEIRDWRVAHTARIKKAVRASRAKFKGVMNVIPFDEEFWPALRADYLAGVTVNDLLKKYPVGWKRLTRYLKTKKITRPRVKVIKDFDELFWEKLEKEYIAGEPIQDLTARYHVDKPRIHRYMEQKGITRERRTKKTTFNEPFWKDLERDFLDGMSLPNLKVKYHTSGNVIERYLEQRGLPSFRERQEKQMGFSGTVWSAVTADYLDGLGINSIAEKYKIGKKRLLRFLESKKLTRPTPVRLPKRFDEPFWHQLGKDFLDGMPFDNLKSKYKVGEKRIRRYLKENNITRPPKRRFLRRRNPEESFLPARLSEVERVKQEITQQPPAGTLLPSCPLASEIPDDQPMIPRATFDVMLSGRFPLIRTPEGKSWQIKPAVITSMSRLMTQQGMADANKWYDLLAACGTGATLYVMDSHGERYRVLDIEIDYGGETGEVILQHLGRRSRGGKTMRVDIWDAFGKMLPFVVYKGR